MDPVTMMLMGQMASSIIGGRKNAKAQKALSIANRNNAVDAMTDEVSALNEQTRQSEEVTSAQKRSARLQAINAKSTAEAVGRNSTVNGDRALEVIDKMLNDSLRNAKLNDESNRRNLKRRKKGALSKTQSRINSTPYQSYNPLNDVVGGSLAIMSNRQGIARHETAMAGG